MKKRLNVLLIVVCVVLLGTILGCAAFQNAVIPVWIEKPAVDYVEDVNVPCDVPRLWWTSIADAEMLNKLLDYSHDYRQNLLERAKEDDVAWYDVIKGQHRTNLESGYAVRQELFTPEGTTGLLATTGLGILLGALGISKPSDKKTIENLKNGNSTV